jgi:hypothetical protein
VLGGGVVLCLEVMLNLGVNIREIWLTSRLLIVQFVLGVRLANSIWI